MKRITTIITALVLSVLLPLSASALPIYWEDDTPTTSHEPGLVPPDKQWCRYGTVGQFLWITEWHDTEGTNMRSYEIPRDAVGFTLFEDCSVVFQTGEPVAHKQPSDNERYREPKPIVPVVDDTHRIRRSAGVFPI